MLEWSLLKQWLRSIRRRARSGGISPAQRELETMDQSVEPSKPTPDPEWRKLPMAASDSTEVTDLCGGCGHCRDRHESKEGIISVVTGLKGRCLIPHCWCAAIYRFHQAGCFSPLDTITRGAQTITLRQPRPPGRSIPYDAG